MKRRDFLKSLGGGALAAGVLGRGVHAAPAGFRASDRVFLGPRKIESSRLFLGTGSGGWGGNSDQTRRFGLDGMTAYFKEAYDAGITAWDSADQYGSHPHLKAALRAGIPRDKVTILTKSRASNADEMRSDIGRFLEELGTDYIDILLLHCLTNSDWPRQMESAMNAVDDFQKSGVIRSKGVSCHSLGALKTASHTKWVEVNMARLNPDGAVMDAGPSEVVPVLQRMHNQGTGIIAMKVLGAGRLATEPDRCLDFVLNQSFVGALTVGCRTAQERDDLAVRIKGTERRIS